jgi:hypothetical protein
MWALSLKKLILWALGLTTLIVHRSERKTSRTLLTQQHIRFSTLCPSPSSLHFQVFVPDLATCPVPPLANVTWQARVEAQVAEMRSQVNRFSVDVNKRAQADAVRQNLLPRLNQPLPTF